MKTLPNAREPMFPRTEVLSYENRKLALRPAANDGQAALIVDPYESPLWYVNHYAPLPESSVPRLLDIAKYVIEWSEAFVATDHPGRDRART